LTVGDRWYPPARAHRGHDQQASGGEPWEQGGAHALLVKEVSDSDWQAARQASTSWCASCWWCIGCWRPRSASPTASRRPSRR